MNKLQVIDELIRLSKRTDYVLNTDWCSYKKFSFDKDSTDYHVVEFGVYLDTKGGWLKYYNKDVAKQYELNPVEIKLIKDSFQA